MKLGVSIKLRKQELSMKKLTSLSIIRPLLSQPSFNVDEIKQFGITPAHLSYYIKLE
jgi:hypothetical protein